jgi:hypothetical protein
MRRNFKAGLVAGMLIGAVLFSGIAYAVNFTIVLTQAQVDIATWKWNQVDPSHTKYATAQLFGASEIGGLIEGWRIQRRANRFLDIGSPLGYFCVNTWPGLSQGNKDTVCTTRLGEVTGCTACDVNGD